MRPEKGIDGQVVYLLDGYDNYRFAGREREEYYIR
jgi:hypothetical protein